MPEAPRGHYSASLRAGPLLFVSGQVAPAPGSDLQTQTQECLRKLLGVLEASGAGLEQVARVTVYLADMQRLPDFEQVYAAFFGAHKPARSMVPAGAFPDGILVEIDAIAVLPD
jgi:reactive intermediate/imine deaminase